MKLADFWDISLVVVSGLLVYLSNYLIENRRKKKDELKEYRKELKKYVEDIIYPLYVIFDELFINLLGSVDVIADPPKIVEGTQLTSSRKEIREAQSKIDDFLKEKGLKLNLIFPKNLQSWKLIRLSAGINSIVEEIEKGENPVDKVNDLIAECIDFQKNIKILLGFTFDERLLTTYLDEPINKYEKIKKLFKIFIIFSLSIIWNWIGAFSFIITGIRWSIDSARGIICYPIYAIDIYGIEWRLSFWPMKHSIPIIWYIEELTISVIAIYFYVIYYIFKNYIIEYI